MVGMELRDKVCHGSICLQLFFFRTYEVQGLRIAIFFSRGRNVLGFVKKTSNEYEDRRRMV
jgi:hypothetical protein